jgi:nicotinate-nucleotide adenylyltransferase
VILQPVPLLPVSATDLRERIKAGRSIDGLTPKAVVDYIKQHQLYL